MSIQFLNRLGAIKTRLSGLFGRQRGASGIEYGMLVGLIAVAVLAGVASSGNSISALFVAVCNKLNNVSGGGGTCAGVGLGGSGGSGSVVNGQCVAALSPFSSAPSGSTGCTLGTVTAGSLSGIGDPIIAGQAWSYTCSGSGGGSTATGCTAVSSLDTCVVSGVNAAQGASCNRLKRDGSGTDPVYVVTPGALFAATSDVTNGVLWSTGYGGPVNTGMTSTPYAGSYGYQEATSCDSGTCSAALACYNLGTVNKTVFDQYDWYLPADTDLLATLNALAGTSSSPQHGFFSANASGLPGYYWSASEINEFDVWVRYYSGGVGWLSYSLDTRYLHSLSVRCVRG